MNECSELKLAGDRVRTGERGDRMPAKCPIRVTGPSRLRWHDDRYLRKLSTCCNAQVGTVGPQPDLHRWQLRVSPAACPRGSAGFCCLLTRCYPVFRHLAPSSSQHVPSNVGHDGREQRHSPEPHQEDFLVRGHGPSLLLMRGCRARHPCDNSWLRTTSDVDFVIPPGRLGVFPQRAAARS